MRNSREVFGDPFEVFGLFEKVRTRATRSATSIQRRLQIDLHHDEQMGLRSERAMEGKNPLGVDAPRALIRHGRVIITVQNDRIAALQGGQDDFGHVLAPVGHE